jgi:hypothetical protein
MKRIDASDLPDIQINDFTEWADGGTYEAQQGEDFTATPKSFITSLHRWARRNGYDARTNNPAGGGIVRFRLTPRTD